MHPHVMESIPVHIVGMDTPTTEPDIERREAAQFGSHTSYILSSAMLSGNGPQQILPQDSRRSRATIVLTGATGTLVGNVILVGSREACGAGLPGTAAKFVASAANPGNYSWTEEHAQAVFAIWNQGTAADATGSWYITVIDERYEK